MYFNSNSQNRIYDAVDFTLQDIHGNEYNLFDQFADGKTVILYFFSTTCGMCAIDAPKLDSVYQHYGGQTGNVAVWGIAYPTQTTEVIEDFILSTGISFPCLLTIESENVFDYYDVAYYPQTFVTCHYFSSGRIAYEDMQFYIEGCLSTEIDDVMEEKKVAVYTYQNHVFIKNDTEKEALVEIYSINAVMIDKIKLLPFEERKVSELKENRFFIIKTIIDNTTVEITKHILH